MLTFGFERAINLSSIDLDLFLCPEWNISPYITVYGSDMSNVVFRAHAEGMGFLGNYYPSKPSCECLSTVSFPIQPGEPSYAIWHIVVSFLLQQHVQWVHVGEARFLTMPTDLGSIPTTFSRLPESIP